jgi:hypothetical protein
MSLPATVIPLRLAATLSCLSHRIQDFEDLLQNNDRVLGVVEAEAKEVAARFGRDRRTLVSADTGVCWSLERAYAAPLEHDRYHGLTPLPKLYRCI